MHHSSSSGLGTRLNKYKEWPEQRQRHETKPETESDPQATGKQGANSDFRTTWRERRRKEKNKKEQRQGLQGTHAKVPFSISQRGVELGNSGMEILLDLLLHGDSFPWPVP